MKLLSLAQIARVILLALIPAVSNAVTCNGEIVRGRTPYAPNAGNDWPNFGGHVYARTHLSSTNCNYYATKNAQTGNEEIYPTGQTHDGYNASTYSQDTLGRPIDLVSNVTVMQSQFGGGMSVLRRNSGTAQADVSLGDILWLDKEGAGAYEVTDIPVELCFTFSSMWTPETATSGGVSAAKATIQIGRFHYNGPASQDRYTLDTNIAQVEGGQWVNQQCNSGVLSMKGPGAGYTLRLLLDIGGHRGYEYHGETETSMTTIEGAMTGRFRITSLPSGVTCTSASGVFPGCDRPASCEAPTNDLSLNNQVADIDFVDNELYFLRTYGASDYGNNSELGNNWRHNYSRSFDILTTPESTTAEIINETGQRHFFRKNGIGQWVGSQPEETLEETSTGYIYTTVSGAREFYDLNHRIVQIDYSDSAVFLTYDDYQRLEKVENQNLESLFISYDSEDRIQSITTSQGTYNYLYDDNSNLTGVIFPDGNIREYGYDGDTALPSDSDSCPVIPEVTVSGYNPFSALEAEEPPAEDPTCPEGETCEEPPAEEPGCVEGETCEEPSVEQPECSEGEICESPDAVEGLRETIQAYTEDEAGEQMYKARQALDRANKALEEGRYTDAIKYYREYAFRQAQVAIYIGAASTVLTLAPENNEEALFDAATSGLPVGTAARLGKKALGQYIELGERALETLQQSSKFAEKLPSYKDLSKADWQERVKAGRKFDEEQAKNYPYNQLFLDKLDSNGNKVGNYKLDSYVHGDQIVSRKFTQLSEVQEKTGLNYLREIDKKYAPGSKISDVPSTPPELVGKDLKGTKILEVPVQDTHVPQSILDAASDADIRIRDIEGHIYE